MSIMITGMMFWSNLNKSKKMRERWVYGTIYLGPIMFFRWEKYRFVLVMISFSAFHFCTIIAALETYTKDAKDILTKKNGVPESL